MHQTSRSPDILLSRRTFLQHLASLTAFVAAFPASALASNGPPRFETERQQFRIVRPARNVGDFPMLRLDGTASSFSRFRGKIVLLNFWATWCPACRTELPILDNLQQSMGGTDLQVVAVSVDRGDRRGVERFVRDRRVRHLSIYLDPESHIAHSEGSADRKAPFALYGMPISYVINRSGGVEGYLIGEADWSSDAAKNLLAYYLQKPAA
jgi:thiol-disulfide isomerase/thioredoxin